jgi:hypothetical protein
MQAPYGRNLRPQQFALEHQFVPISKRSDLGIRELSKLSAVAEVMVWLIAI